MLPTAWAHAGSSGRLKILDKDIPYDYTTTGTLWYRGFCWLEGRRQCGRVVVLQHVASWVGRYKVEVTVYLSMDSYT